MRSPRAASREEPLLAAAGESLHEAAKSQRGRKEQEIKKKNLLLPHCASEYIISLRSDNSSEAGTVVLIDEEAEAPKSKSLAKGPRSSKWQDCS